MAKLKEMVVGIGAVVLILGVCASEVGRSTPTGFTDDFAAAKSEAAMAKKNIIAVFSGSDWCHWCKVLEKDYLSKPEFVEEAKKNFVLVFIDNPRDKSVLSETAKKNNEKLTEQYDIQGFPTVKILDAEGKEITDLRPERGASPKEYAVALGEEVKFGPLLKRYVEPFQTEMEAVLKDYAATVQAKRKELAKTKTDEALDNAAFEELKKATKTCLAKLKALKAKADAAKTPHEIKGKHTQFVKSIEETIQGLDRVAKMSWDDVKKLREGYEKKNP